MYEIKYAPDLIEKDLPTLDASVRAKILKIIGKKLKSHPEAYGKPLRQDLKGYYKLKVGDWRIIYEIKPSAPVVWIVKIAHRSEVYKP